MKSNKLFKGIVLIIVLAMVLAACQKAPAAPSQTLRVNMGTFPDMIDPQKSSFVNEIATLMNIYEGLTRLNTKLETEPGAAEKWEYNADATEITFTLRKDLKYSDGTILNAKRFEYALFRLLDPTTAGEYAGSIDTVVGALEYRSADLAIDPAALQALKDKVGIKALDTKGQPCTDYEQKDCLVLNLKLTQSTPYMHTVLYMWVAYPVKQELVEASRRNLVGKPRKTMLEMDPSNWSAWNRVPQCTMSQIRITGEVSQNSTCRCATSLIRQSLLKPTRMMNSMSYHWPLKILRRFRQMKCLMRRQIFTQVLALTPSSSRPSKNPLQIKKVREAFAYATDREGWVKDIMKGLGTPTLSWIPEGWPAYDATEDQRGGMILKKPSRLSLNPLTAALKTCLRLN